MFGILPGTGLGSLGGQPTPVHGLVKAPLAFQQEDDRSGFIAASYGHAGLSNRQAGAVHVSLQHKRSPLSRHKEACSVVHDTAAQTSCAAMSDACQWCTQSGSGTFVFTRNLECNI
jgi:hypothetical protein